jgi:hypothetical protein
MLARHSGSHRTTGGSSVTGLAGARSSSVALVLGLIAWGLFASYLIWRVVQGPVLTWQDTTSYLAVARHPFPSVALLAGARAPVVPLLWKLTGTRTSFALTQTVIAILAWSLLAATVAWCFRSPWRSLLAVVGVLAFASTWQVIEWDWSVLSESISLSAVAVMFAASLWLVRRVTLPRAAVLVAACLVYASARDQGIWVVGIVAMIALVVAVARLIAASPRQASRTALLGLALLTVATVTEIGAVSAHRNVINVEEVFYIRVFPFPQRVAWFAARGMPQSAALDSLAATTEPTPGEAKIVAPDLRHRQWHALSVWFSHRSQLLYAEYLLTHPGYDLTAPFSSPELSYNDPVGILAFYAGPQTPLPVLSTIMFPPFDAVEVIAFLTEVLILTRRLWRIAEIRVMIVMGIVGLLAALIAWHGDGEEIARHTIEGNVEARLAVLLLLSFGLPWSHRATPRDRMGTPAHIDEAEVTVPVRASVANDLQR